jgi:hypothetical protein
MPSARTVTAFLFAPLAIPLAVALASIPLSLTKLQGGQGLLLGFSIACLPPAYIAELLFGIPAWLIFRRYAVRSWSVFAMTGIVLGTVYYLIYSIVAVLAKAGGYHVSVHSFTNDWLNPGVLWIDIPAGLLSLLLFRAIVLPWRSKSNHKVSAI